MDNAEVRDKDVESEICHFSFSVWTHVKTSTQIAMPRNVSSVFTKKKTKPRKQHKKKTKTFTDYGNEWTHDKRIIKMKQISEKEHTHKIRTNKVLKFTMYKAFDHENQAHKSDN